MVVVVNADAGHHGHHVMVLVDHQQLGGELVEHLGGDQFADQVVRTAPCPSAICPDIPCKYKITQAAWKN